FLSGGQSDADATAHLDAMNKIGGLPWKLTFSYGRALQAAPQKAWSGKTENVAAAQRAFTHRAMMNGLASLGQWKQDLEKKPAKTFLGKSYSLEENKTAAEPRLRPAPSPIGRGVTRYREVSPPPPSPRWGEGVPPCRG